VASGEQKRISGTCFEEGGTADVDKSRMGGGGSNRQGGVRGGENPRGRPMRTEGDL